MDMGDDRSDAAVGIFNPFAVKLDELSARCIYVYDESSSPPTFRPTQAGTEYNLTRLVCASPAGMLPIQQLPRELVSMTPSMLEVRALSLNPAYIQCMRFVLSQHSPDISKRVVLNIPPTAMTPPFSLTASLESDPGVLSDPICLYIIPHMGMMPSMKYHTNIVFCALRCSVNCECHIIDPNNQVIIINPEQMTMEFLHTLNDVHITGNLQIPACPTERLIAARVSIPEILSEPVCQLLDQLNIDLPATPDPRNDIYALFRLPFVYEINVQARTCTRTPIVYTELSKDMNETGVSYLEFEQYMPIMYRHERLLIQNMLFQMMFIYEKTGAEFITSCPPHKMVFDFYIRRNSGQVAFHYDTTPLFQVTTLSLLFSMPQGVVRPGPYIAPLLVQTAPDGGLLPDYPEHGAPPGVCTLMVKRGTCIMANNHIVTHSTPGMRQLIERGVQDVPFMRLDVTQKFNFPFMHVPGQFQEMMEASAKVPRSFLRMWHVNVKPETNPAYFRPPEPMFPDNLFGPDEFTRILQECIQLQSGWWAGQTCTCVNIHSASPMEMREAIQGKASGLLGGRQSQYKRPSSNSKSLRVVNESIMQDKSKLRARASTISVARENIKKKLAQLTNICNNPNQNVIFMTDAVRSRSHMRTRRSVPRRSLSRRSLSRRSVSRRSRKSNTRRVKSSP